MLIQTRIILLLLIWVTSFLNVYSQSIKFNHLTIENGLSNNDVNTVIQDKTGYIWFGTDDGLNRYDGYNFKIFRNNPSDSNSLSDNSIWCLMEDRKGNIWIGTKGGVLNKYDPATEKFTHWKIKSSFTEENSLTTLYENSKGQIWIGSYKEGIYRLNPLTNKIDHWKSDPNNSKSISHNFVKDIIEDENGNVLIGTYIGFNRFNPDSINKGFKRFYFNPKNEKSISNNLIWAITKSNYYQNVFWVGTANGLDKFNYLTDTFEKILIQNKENILYANSVSDVIETNMDDKRFIFLSSYVGLIKVDLVTGETIRFRHDPDASESLIDNQINKIIKDRSGVIWIATENGISYFSPKNNKFNYSLTDNKYSRLIEYFKNKNITAIGKSSNGILWFGTTEGLYYLNSKVDKENIYKLDKLGKTHIWSLSTDSSGDLWIGTYGKGLKQYNFNKNKIVDWNLDDPKIQTQSLYYNRSLLSDSKKNIWVGYWGVGVAIINPTKNKYKVWLNEPGNTKSLSYNDVWTIKEDRFGRIWIGTTGGGLNLFSEKENSIFLHWLQKTGEQNSINSNNIYSICESKFSVEDKKTTLWIGTSNGLNQFIIKNKDQDPFDFNVEIKSYTVKDGLPDNSVSSILEYENGNLWIGTASGISLFDVAKKTFTNFTIADGLNGTVMNYESALKLDDGIMLFGSTKGLNIFDPKKIELSMFKPPVVITDFQIFNQSVAAGENSLLKENISNTKKIFLPYDKDVFSFEFAALDYNSPGSINYAYKMEGFDEDWILSGKRRFVTYTNLDPGTYTFKVKATNSDGIWNDQFTSVAIIINPPWWRTPWAYIAYVILIMLGLFTIRRFEINRSKLRDELKMHEFEAEQKSKLEEMKSRFFANLSHEFRTPLTLIKGPLELLEREKNNQTVVEQIEIIKRNSDKLKELIDQLLELSQLENTTILLRASKENIVSLLKGLVSSFESLALQKHITLKFNSNIDYLNVWVDNSKFEKIINNLLSNAFKFTPESGTVEVGIKNITVDQNKFAEIIIADNGIGIPKEKLNNIFDRFYQVDDSSHRSYGGSGIGLSLVKELIDLHKWEIFVESNAGKGAKFIIRIPLLDTYLNDSEKIVFGNSSKTFTKEKTNQELKLADKKITVNDNNIPSNGKQSILIVEDSEDLRKYLSDLLKNNYTISEAANGELGIKVATEILPDLIISDVMMPLMDGFEFCEKIKSKWQTSDIPVILLTAKASFESKLEGLEIGADDYLTKPFHSRELFIRIKNLLEQRKRIREKYNKEIETVSSSNIISTADEEFINKALSIVEKNIDKTNFNTEELAKELFISRTQLHRKILAISGQTPGEFIRIIKLKKAANMLLEKKLTVTQIAYEIGFASPAQFTRAFSKQYKCLPSEYSNK